MTTDQQQPGSGERGKSAYEVWTSQQRAGFFYRPDLVFEAGQDSLRAQLADMQRQRDEYAKLAMIFQSQRDTLRAEVERLKPTAGLLAEAGVILTVLAYGVKWELAPEVLAEARRVATLIADTLPQPSQ